VMQSTSDCDPAHEKKSKASLPEMRIALTRAGSGPPTSYKVVPIGSLTGKCCFRLLMVDGGAAELCKA
jgi:hypothetical protein